MTTINTIQDFLQILDDNPSWREAVRARIVGEELMALPARFDAFVARVEAFIAQQEAFNARVEAFIAQQEAFNARVEAFIAQQEAFNARVEAFIARVEAFIAQQEAFNAQQEAFNASILEAIADLCRRSDNADARMNRMESDIAEAKGGHVRSLLDKLVYGIIEDMGYDTTEVLHPKDINIMSRSIPAATRDERRSFRQADTIALATDPANGESIYIAIEASWTADVYDVTRAQRNARYITHATGARAIPAIASMRNTREVDALVDAGVIHWHKIAPRDLQAE